MHLLVTVCVLLEVLVIALAKSYLVLCLPYRDTPSRARSLSQQPFESIFFFVTLNSIPPLVLVSLHSSISRKSVLDSIIEHHLLLKDYFILGPLIRFSEHRLLVMPLHTCLK